jgi:hypothetical protein
MIGEGMCHLEPRMKGVPYRRFVTGAFRPLCWVRRLSFGFLHNAWLSNLTSTPIMSVPPQQLENATSQPTNPARTLVERAKATGWTIVHHAKRHTGVGIVCAVAYFDP